MKHAGKARRAGWTILGLSFAGLLALETLIRELGDRPLAGERLCALVWGVFAIFTLYFFRDPEARPPEQPGLLLAPAHGTVDAVDETVEPEFMGGPCRRISIFLSVLDIHVQQAPATGRVAFVKHTAGRFLNALNADSAKHNENVLAGIELAEPPGVKVGVRLIAGLIARRIVPWIVAGDKVEAGQRISLIQFGSRCDLYFPFEYEPRVAPGSKVRGGESIVAWRRKA